MNKELMEALDMLEKEKNISKESLFEAIENSLMTACSKHFKKAYNIKVEIDHETCEYRLFAEKEVIPDDDEPIDKMTEVCLSEAKEADPDCEVGDLVNIEIQSTEFTRIATQNAKNVILQKIREEERNAIYREYSDKEHQVVTGVVQRFIGRNVSVNLGRTDALLNEKEQIRGERYRIMDRMKVYVLEVRDSNRGPRIMVSRTHPELVKKLFEQEVTEIKDGTVKIVGIAREPGSRSKIAVYSYNPNVDPVGACVGVNGSRVSMIVDELNGEKIDIIPWDDNPGNLIQNALSPAKVVHVFADPEEQTANVVVPDKMLSLAIGKEGQNARLAARLTGYKIDIKSETQAKDAPGFRPEDYLDDEYDDEEEGYYDEDGMYIGDPEEDYETEYEEVEDESDDAEYEEVEEEEYAEDEEEEYVEEEEEEEEEA